MKSWIKICLVLIGYMSLLMSCTQAELDLELEAKAPFEQEMETEAIAETHIEEEIEEEQVVESYADIYASTGYLEPIKKVYKDDFFIGVALSAGDLRDPRKAALVAEQFNSITCENEMKPDFLLDHNATLDLGDETFPVVNMENALTHLEFAKAHGIQMRAHTLVWHAQTPIWLFKEGFANSTEAPYVTKEVMQIRMKNYIEQVMTYTHTHYPGIIYAWDVVNEAIAPGEGHENGIRIQDNPWYDVLGEAYVELAFTYARQYATAEQKLYYNDYGTYDKNKLFKIRPLLEGLIEKGLIDGMGMQDHMTLTEPNVMDYQYTINQYADLGLDIQVTELDINAPDNEPETQSRLAIRYRNIMAVLRNAVRQKDTPVSNVTFWGLTDDRSWLNNDGTPSYPLLFDENLEPKPAFFGAILDTSIPTY